MTIEEIINKHCQRCNIAYDTIEALCIEVRRLTIEECRKKAKVLKIVEGFEDSIFSDELFEIQPHYFEKFGVFQYNFTIDSTSFPTDLNRIDL